MDWKNFSKYLVQKEHIAGVSITEDSIRLVLFSDKKEVLAKIETDLDDGIIESGEIKKPEELKKALETMRNSPSLAKIKNLYTVLALSDELVYHKIFDLPVVSAAGLTEAVDLNLKMISPIKFEEAYTDWELFESTKESGLKYRVSAIFGKKDIIDPYLDALVSSGFVPLAVESQAMSFWRLFSEKELLPEGKKSCLIVYISSEGVDFSVMSKEGLKFNYFQDWQGALKTSLGTFSDMPIKNLKREDFFKVFTEQSRRIFSFYANRFDDEVVCFYLLSPIYQTALDQIVSKQFSIASSKQPTNFEYSPGFFGSAGSALRGLIPRTDDLEPSLMGVGTEEEYRQSRIFSFINIWNKVIITAVVLLVAAFLGVLLFFNFSRNNLESSLDNLNVKIDKSQFEELGNKANLVNLEISEILKAQNATSDWSGFLDFWQKESQKKGVELIKMNVSARDKRVIFLGSAPSETDMIDFKNNLGGSGYLSNVEIPLQSIAKKKNRVEFNLNFVVERLP